MVSKEDQRARAITLLSAGILKNGLSHTSLRQLAMMAGISDRMLLYYFKDKADVIMTAVSHIALDMTQRLDAAISNSPKLAPSDLITRALAVTQGVEMKPFMQLWIEIVAAASRGQQPYFDISRLISAGFVAWIKDRLQGEPSKAKDAQAAMIFAVIDGLALVDMCAGKEQAQLAVQGMGQISFPE